MVKRTWMISLACLAGLMPGGLRAQTAPGTTGGGDSFVERFIRMSPNRWVISHGWLNGPQQGCLWSKDNVRDNANALELLLSGRGTGEKGSCAEVQTKAFYGYGTYEARLRSIAGSGIITSFFLYTGPNHSEHRQHQQIGLEFPGRSTRAIEINYFAEGKKHFHESVALDFDASKSTHDYAFEWLPNSLRWFVDGRVVGEALPNKDHPLPTFPSKLILTVWNGAGPSAEWLGPFEGTGETYSAVVERVVFTRMGQPCQFGASIVCKRGADHKPK